MIRKTLIMAFIGILFSLSSCREDTEMNTDGNIEEEETRRVEDAG